MRKKYDIAMIGLAVMGENLARNFFDKGYSVIGYDIELARVERFNQRFQRDGFEAVKDLQTMVEQLKKPRIVMMMIKAGDPVDEMIEKLIPLLEKEDIIIDGGNSLYQDTIRRTKTVEQRGFYFVGTGVSGGEIGALKGPSMMPGGSPKAWPIVEKMFEAISAKTKDGFACAKWVGPNGAGHFVKMVHNGIEYGDLQIINEVYDVMKRVLKMTNLEMANVFKRWNEAELESYLIEITSDILQKKDESGKEVVDLIVDKAGQKGTGKWTAVESLELGVPLTLISESVYARFLSSQKEERIKASKHYPKEEIPFEGEKAKLIEALKDTLYVAKILSYAQGYLLLKKANDQYQWNLQFGEIAKLWQAGCIIRSQFLEKITNAYEANPLLENLLLDPYFQAQIIGRMSHYRQVLSLAITHQIPTPSLSSGLAYFDGYTSPTLPANLLQAQRDYFGAHMVEFVDQPEGKFFHIQWTEEGGETASSSYNS